MEGPALIPTPDHAVRRLVLFAVALGVAFAGAWAVGDQVGPAPEPERAEHGSMEAHG